LSFNFGNGVHPFKYHPKQKQAKQAHCQPHSQLLNQRFAANRSIDRLCCLSGGKNRLQPWIPRVLAKKKTAKGCAPISDIDNLCATPFFLFFGCNSPMHMLKRHAKRCSADILREPQVHATNSAGRFGGSPRALQGWPISPGRARVGGVLTLQPTNATTDRRLDRRIVQT